MLLKEATLVLVAVPPRLLQNLRLVQNQKPFTQGPLNDLVRDLGLSNESSQILASRLGEHGILDSGNKMILHLGRDD